MSIWNWELLDSELIDLYKVDNSAVKKFSNKYKIPINTIYRRLKVLHINVKVMGHENPKGENSHNWKGGKHITRDGYVKVYIGSNGKYEYDLYFSFPFLIG